MNLVVDSSENDQSEEIDSEFKSRFKTEVTERDLEKWWSEEKFKATAALWDLSPEEIENMKELRSSLSDIFHWKNQPSEVVRFMRARPEDLKAQIQMFKNMIQWRKDNNVESILSDYKPHKLLWRYYPGAMLKGRDKEGDPIYIERLGVTDAPGLLNQLGEDEMIKHAIWTRELISKGKWIQKYEKTQERPVRRITIIEDLDGLSRRMLWGGTLSAYKKIMRLDQDNYCETAKKLIIIRAPWVFRMIWGIVSYFFDPGVVAKMTFCGHDDYLDVLEKHMDLRVLPKELYENGEGVAEDECPPHFDGGVIPEEDLTVEHENRDNE